jgi:hypothetical protein
MYRTLGFLCSNLLFPVIIQNLYMESLLDRGSLQSHFFLYLMFFSKYCHPAPAGTTQAVCQEGVLVVQTQLMMFNKRHHTLMLLSTTL